MAGGGGDSGGNMLAGCHCTLGHPLERHCWLAKPASMTPKLILLVGKHLGVAMEPGCWTRSGRKVAVWGWKGLSWWNGVTRMWHLTGLSWRPLGGDRKIKYVMGSGKSWSIGLVHRIPDAGRWGSPGTWFVEKGVVWK